MTALAEVHAPPRRTFSVALVAWIVTLVAVIAVAYADDLPKWATDYPRAWRWDLQGWISAAMKWLINDATFGLFTFKEFTRSIAWVLDWFLTAAYGFLATGFDISDAADGSVIIPRISWIALIAVVLGRMLGVKDGAGLSESPGADAATS